MANYRGDDGDYMGEARGDKDIDGKCEGEFPSGEMESHNPDSNEYDYTSNELLGTTAEQAQRGKDIQGIPWERLDVRRDNYRKTRLEQYKNYENVPQSRQRSGEDAKITQKGCSFYEFRKSTRSVKPTILHFQKHPGNLLEGFTQTQVSTLAVQDRLLVAGGFGGELICKLLDRPGISYCCQSTYDDNAITNAVEIYANSSGSTHFIASNNDCGVRDYDTERFQLVKHFHFGWPVNHGSLSPDGKLLIIVGDDPVGLLVDAETGKNIMHLRGHLDFSFASAWHPDGVTFATGNQDKTTRIWDVRNMSKSVAVLKGNLGAIRSIRYTSDGQYLAMAEPADFVHLYDIKSGYEKEQEIGFFGEISGKSFSPDTESLFIGVSDNTYGGLLEYGRRQN